jgi:hypothetical protein
MLRRYYYSANGYCWVLARTASVVGFYALGAYFYHITEDWTILDSVYFVTVTVSTIGYGDYHPTNDTGRLFTSFFIIAGLVIVLSAVDELAKYGIIRFENNVLMGAFSSLSHLVRV